VGFRSKNRNAAILSIFPLMITAWLNVTAWIDIPVNSSVTTGHSKDLHFYIS
jgi:hypothetical protein